MKVALGIISRPIESLLVLCLRPVIAHFDGLIMLTSPEPKWKHSVKALLRDPSAFHLFDDYVWKHDYADARNTVIIHAQELGYDWLMMLDADESMLPDDLIVMRKYMETEESLVFPRYEFVDDFEHFVPWFYPDSQARAFRLNIGYRYVNSVHEQLIKKNQLQPASMTTISTFLPQVHIWHYGKCKRSSDVWLKYRNYDRISAGQVPIAEMPENEPLPETWALDKKKIRFIGNKPL